MVPDAKPLTDQVLLNLPVSSGRMPFLPDQKN
jgi:hypothetical protein